MGATESCAQYILANNEEKALHYLKKKIEKKGAPELWNEVAKCKSTILVAACKANMENLCMFLLQFPTNCNLSYIDEDNFTAFMYACYNEMHQVVTVMLRHSYLCKLDHVDNKGFTALSYLDFNTMEALVLKIIACEHSCGLNYVDAYDNTPLMLACINKKETIALSILGKKQDCCLYATNKSNQTALDLAIFNDMMETARVILNLYSNKAKELVKDNFKANESLSNIYKHINESSRNDNNLDLVPPRHNPPVILHSKSTSMTDFPLKPPPFPPRITTPPSDPYLETYQRPYGNRYYPPSFNAKYYKNTHLNKTRHTAKIYLSSDKVEHYYLKGGEKIQIIG